MIRLEDIAACPACHSALEWPDLRCAACGARYERVEGVPVLAVTPVPAAVPRPAERIRRLVRPVLSQKFAAAALVERFVGSFGPDAVVINIGSGTQDYGPTVVNLDIAPLESVDVVGHAEALPFGDASCDGCVLQAVLEHVEDAGRVLAEIHRVLVPDGRVLVDVPFIQGYHAAPRDYRRFTAEGLKSEVERRGFTVEAAGISVGPASAMAAVTAEFLALLLSGRSVRAYRLARLVTSWIAFPLKYADVWLERHPRAGVIASGTWVQARKMRAPSPV
jgi:SAM-dependent methyltransferase